jgi:hypothetical protein
VVLQKIARTGPLHLAAGAAALPALSRVAWAQAYPSRPVRLIVPITPAGAADIVARLIGQWLSERLGQPFIIENRPGAGTNIGTEAVVRARADGYTLLLVSVPNAINATLYDRLNFNFIRDIAPMAGINREAHVMVVTPSVPAKTVPVHRVRQGHSGQDQHGIGRQWNSLPCGRRTVQDDDRRQHGSRAVSRRGARACCDPADRIRRGQADRSFE